MTASIKPRRKPSQSRAWMTSLALQEAFVQLLLEKDYESITMRDIALVSGVSIGGLYRYFPSKEAIAAMAVRTWVRKVSTALASMNVAEGCGLEDMVRAWVKVQVATMLEGVESWRVLSTLERRVTPQPVYNRIYMHHVHLFRQALVQCGEWPAQRASEHEAFNAYTLIDALIKQSLLVRPTMPDQATLNSHITQAVCAYLRASLAQGPAPAPDPLRAR